MVQVSAEDYLAERKALGWENFKPGDTYRPQLQPRAKKYDLIITLDMPGAPNGVIDPDILPVKTTASDPGPGRGLVQYVAMPVFDSEDALVLSGGDSAGLLAAAQSLAQPPQEQADMNKLQATTPIVQPDLITLALDYVAKVATPPNASLREFIGIPIGQVAASRDGQRIAVALKGWGNNVFVLDANGKVLGGDMSGKFFPLDLSADAGGFWVTSYENDPTMAYRKHYDLNGRPTLRLAADGRRLGGARDWSASHPIVQDRFEPQASFSLSVDGRFAAVGGSRGIAVWDVPAHKILWRDDTACHTVPLSQKADVAPDASMFPQVKLSPDGAMLVLQHHNRIFLRDGKTGKALGEQKLPEGAALGRARVFDGHTLVVGDTDFFAFRDGKPWWHWKAPKEVSALAFAPDGAHFAVGEPDGTVRILLRDGQVGGYVAPAGGIDSLAISTDAARIAFSTSAGQVGVLDGSGQVIWQSNIGNTRAQIALLDAAGDTVVGDWRGLLSRYSPAGKRLWIVDLTPKAYRADLDHLLTVPDATSTLRVPPPPRPANADLLPDPARKVTPADIRYVQAAGWHGPVDAQWPGSLLMTEQKEPPAKPWFTRDGAYWLAGAPAAPAFDMTFREPVTLDMLLVREDPAHPEVHPTGDQNRSVGERQLATARPRPVGARRRAYPPFPADHHYQTTLHSHGRPVSQPVDNRAGSVPDALSLVK